MQLSRQMKWSEQEYLAFEEHSETKHEYLDGEVYAMAGAKTIHNVICANAIRLLGNMAHGGRCQVFTSDQRIHVARPNAFYTYADGGVACGTWQISDKDGMSLLNPVLLFEVLSPSTEKYDRGAKLFLYRQIDSITDILLIDQPARLVEHHHRGARGWKSTSRHRGAIATLGGLIQMEALYQVPVLG